MLTVPGHHVFKVRPGVRGVTRLFIDGPESPGPRVVQRELVFEQELHDRTQVGWSRRVLLQLCLERVVIDELLEQVEIVAEG